MSAPISKGDLAKIARQHSDIPQDALFPEPPAVGATEASSRDKPIASVQWEICPHHVPSGRKPLTGLVEAVEGLTFRDHTKHVGHHIVPCPGSGTVWAGR